MKALFNNELKAVIIVKNCFGIGAIKHFRMYRLKTILRHHTTMSLIAWLFFYNSTPIIFIPYLIHNFNLSGSTIPCECKSCLRACFKSVAECKADNTNIPANHVEKGSGKMCCKSWVENVNLVICIQKCSRSFVRNYFLACAQSISLASFSS